MAFEIPEEYRRTGSMREYSVEDYVNQRIQQAVQTAIDRKEPYQRPEWFDNWAKATYGEETDPAEVWEDCISTALDSYGIKNPPTGNKTFIKDHSKLGFEKVASFPHIKDAKEPRDYSILRNGDLLQLKWRENGNPYHTAMVTQQVNEEYSNPRVHYGNGFGKYHKDIVDDKFYKGDGFDVYRFTGDPEALDAINKHNAEVAKEKEGLKDLGVREDIKPIETATPSASDVDIKQNTANFLDNMVKRGRK